ncbi:dihydrofolate reductase family protein [Caldibacillus lycopersici]|uniref:Dihydrofolate reductase family protein n=1 Tax=Perspicuibacillus lycopersici TaxID=1325689 RepID=A0AAE3LQ98_9BACI|nr:dihydrofolate reductase family protein [Perspicuibacillus lycopersici]MCU9613239.1 dihydrofolate reductase family protein [Perspicuibacillus lycopersici]
MSNQRNVVFYGAISVDGYLAREDHSLDWLLGTEGEEESGYFEFYDTVDTILMGRKTYEQILILSPNEFPYKGKECYVFSRTMTAQNEDVTFINDDIVSFTKKLKEQEGKRIWMVGGGEVLNPMLQAKLVDEFIIQIAPTIIGKGIPLFTPSNQDTKLELVDVRRFKQFAELYYRVK